MDNLPAIQAIKVRVYRVCLSQSAQPAYRRYDDKYKTVMEMMLRHKDTFPWERLFSHHFPLAQAEQAVKASMTRESMKVVIDPWME